MNLAATIANMEACGMSADMIVTALKCIVASDVAKPVDEQAERRRAADRERKRSLRNSAESADTPSPLVPPLEVSPAPLPKPPPIIPPTPQSISARDDADQAISEWNALASDIGLPKVQRLTDLRRKRLSARLRDCGGIDGWRAAMAKIRGSPLCRGEINDWRADFDFVLQESSFVKLMEGKYDGRHPGTGPKAAKRSSLDDTFAKIDAVLDEAERREQAAFAETG